MPPYVLDATKAHYPHASNPDTLKERNNERQRKKRNEKRKKKKRNPRLRKIIYEWQVKINEGTQQQKYPDPEGR